MARMRSAKQKLKDTINSPEWRSHLDEIAKGGLENVGPLFSFLLLGPQTMHRAAVALGQVTARLAETQPEAAKNIIRRLMWHLTEESGNIGWGIPNAFAEILAASAPLAKDFHRILISYIIDLGHDDNFCDHDILRRSCYWGIGRLAQERPGGNNRLIICVGKIHFVGRQNHRGGHDAHNAVAPQRLGRHLYDGPKGC